MRLVYAHDALLRMPPGAVDRAPGGLLGSAVGAPMVTAASREGDRVRLRAGSRRSSAG